MRYLPPCEPPEEIEDHHPRSWEIETGELEATGTRKISDSTRKKLSKFVS